MPTVVQQHRLDGAPPSVVSVEDVEWHESRTHSFSFKRLLQFMGPGILMSIAYVDPGNLESDLQVGAQAGYVLLWLLLLSTLMGLVVQMQAAKLGVVTGKHLAQHCRRQYPRVPRLALWLMAEVAIIGSDVQEVIGSAIALALLSGGRLPLWAGVLLTAADSFALLFIERLGIRVLEGFFAGMIGVMVGTFGVMYSQAGVPVGEVFRGFTVPQLPKKDLPVAVALMGSLIMPHNIYLHSALVQTRRLGSDHPSAKREALTYFGIESALSLVVAVVINLFITAVFAAGFYGAELPDIGLQNAGKYLGETYGTAVVYIWALGLLAAGQSSTMTGTYTGQFVMSGYLDLKVSPWARVAITRAVAIAPTLVVALICDSGSGGKDGEVAPSNQLDQLNQALNLLQSIQLPFALVPVLTFTSSRAIMGEFVNSAATAALCWAIAALVLAINGLAVYQVAYETVVADPWVSGISIGILVSLYLLLITYLALGPRSQLGRWMGWSHEEEEGTEALLPLAADGSRLTTAAAEAAAALGPGRRGVDESWWAAAAAGAGRRAPDELAEAGEAPYINGTLNGRDHGVVKAACGCCVSCRCWVTDHDGKAGGKAAPTGKVASAGGGGDVKAPVCCCRRAAPHGSRETGGGFDGSSSSTGGGSSPRSAGEHGELLMLVAATDPEGALGLGGVAEPAVVFVEDAEGAAGLDLRVVPPAAPEEAEAEDTPRLWGPGESRLQAAGGQASREQAPASTGSSRAGKGAPEANGGCCGSSRRPATASLAAAEAATGARQQLASSGGQQRGRQRPGCPRNDADGDGLSEPLLGPEPDSGAGTGGGGQR